MTSQQALAAIRAAREKAGITQTDAAKRAGIKQSTWSNGESGKRPLLPETILRMAAAVGLKLKYQPERFARAK